MKVRCVRKSKFPERRLTYGKEYEVLDTFVINESVDGIDKEVTYIQIIDNVGNKENYAMQYGDDIWFKDQAEIRNETTEDILKSK